MKTIDKRVQTKLTNEPLTQTQVNEDVNFYVNQVEKISPVPYLFSNKKRIDSITTDIKQKGNLKPLEFFKEFLVLQGAYNVGHMYAYFPSKQYQDYIESGGKVFPFKVECVNDSIKIKTALVDELKSKEGFALLSLNGHNIDSLFKVFSSYEGGLSEYKKRKAAATFGSYLWLNNIHAPYNIIYSGKQGILTEKLEGYRPERKKKASVSSTPSFNKMITYEIIDSIAYINFKSMVTSEPDRYRRFLEETFKDIQQKHVNTLFIDLSKNSGGNSVYGEYLLDYLASRPYRMAAGKQWKVSAEYKYHFKKMLPWYARGIAIRMAGFKSYYKHRNDTLYNGGKSSENLHTPAITAYRYSGKTYVIIGNKTFSSAMMTANAIEDFDLATLVGESTGECPNDLGEIVPVRLPNSGITTWIPSALFTRANGNAADPNPVFPDIYLPKEMINQSDKSIIIKEVLKRTFN